MQLRMDADGERRRGRKSRKVQQSATQKRPSSFVFAKGADRQSQLLLSPVHERHPLNCLFYSTSAGGPRLVCFPAHGTHTTQRARNLNKQNADSHFIASCVN